jgi:pimeloyl-ACP methyl ester carboxylesterase
MSDSELAVFVSAFESSGFTGSINWYRNLDRNWHLLADVNPIPQQPTLMIYGDRDVVPKSEKLIKQMEVDVGVLPKSHKGLLGLDILKSNGFILDMGKLELRISESVG